MCTCAWIRSRRVPEGKRRERGVAAWLGPAALGVLLTPSAKTPVLLLLPQEAHASMRTVGTKTHNGNLVHSLAKRSERDQKAESIKK